MNRKERALLVTFGRGGDTVYYDATGDKCGASRITGSGYGTPDRPHAADPKTHNIPAGTPAINLLPAVENKEGFSWVFRSPLVDVTLKDDEIETCPEPSPLFAYAVAGNEFGTLLAMQKISKIKSSEPGPLDSVSIKAFIDGWRNHGAIIGHYDATGNIIWEGKE